MYNTHSERQNFSKGSASQCYSHKLSAEKFDRFVYEICINIINYLLGILQIDHWSIDHTGTLWDIPLTSHKIFSDLIASIFLGLNNSYVQLARFFDDTIISIDKGWTWGAAFLFKATLTRMTPLPIRFESTKVSKIYNSYNMLLRQYERNT